MKTIYIIWNKSFEWDDPIPSSDSIVFISYDYESALNKFKFYIELCNNFYNDSKWCYEYSLYSYIPETYPIEGKLIMNVNNIINEETCVLN